MDMNNEKILEAARKNKNRGKEFEENKTNRSYLWGNIVTLFIGTVLFLLEYFIKGTVNKGLLAVAMTFAAVQFLYEGYSVKKIYLIVLGGIMTLIAVIFILAFIGQVVL